MRKGHPLGKKNVVRTVEEKKQIVLEYLNGEAGYRIVANSHDTSVSVLRKWINSYQKKGDEGLVSKTGKCGKSGRYNRVPTQIDKLKDQLLEKDIEIERLKKGYQVKGDGAKKEFVTTFDANTKSLKE